MFSFFKSSNKNKPSPVGTPTEPQSNVPPQSNIEEREYVMIEPKDSAPLYPNFNHFGGPVPYPARPAPPAPFNRQDSIQLGCHNYFTSGVPFKLSHELSQNDDEIARFQMNELIQQIQKMTTQNLDYDFSVEREVLGSM